jgi:hypothetical protein
MGIESPSQPTQIHTISALFCVISVGYHLKLRIAILYIYAESIVCYRNNISKEYGVT